MTQKEKLTRHQLKGKLERFQLGLAGLWDVIWNAIKNYQYNGNTNQAAAISLYAILSFIPLFILTVIVITYIFASHPDIQKDLIGKVRDFSPFFSDSLLAQLGRIDQKKTVLGWVGVISLLWFSATIFSSIETAMNIIFRAKKNRNYILSKLLAISMIPMAWAVAVASVGITYVATIITKQSIISGYGYQILPYLHGALFRLIIPYVITVAFFTIVYKVIPTESINWRHAFTGAAVFAVLTEVAKHFFTWYVSNYTRYNVIFGSLEAVVILVIWVFYVALILLFCAELISSYRRRDLILLEKVFAASKKKLLKVEERIFRKFGRVYPKGSYVFREGDTDQAMFYIIMGHIRVEKSAGQVKKVLAELKPGNYFGEMAALIDAPRTASAQATVDSELAVIDGQTFRNLLRESEEVTLFMLKEFSKRIKHTNMALEELTKSWIKLNVIIYFIQEWPLRDNQDPVVDLARDTRKEPDEIKQVLEDLCEKGVLTMRDGHITDFSRDDAWKLVTEEIFFPERRSQKRAFIINPPKTSNS